jgi:hypothetical protein
MGRFFSRRNKFAYLLSLAILILLFGSYGHMPERVLADGGGFPTRTRTATLIPLFPTETTEGGLFLGFPGTATDTPVPASGVQQALPEVSASNAPQTRQGFSLLSCWPFAIVALVVLIVGALYISGKSKRSTAP